MSRAYEKEELSLEQNRRRMYLALKHRRIYNLVEKMYFIYPEATRESIKDNYFGTEVVDHYRWLEDPDSEKTKAYVDAQNAVTSSYINECPYKNNIKETITKMWNYPKYSVPYRHGKRYYQYRNTGLQNQNVIYCQESLENEARIFLDPNTFAEDGTVALSDTAFSEDGNTIAYGVSTNGSDWLDIKFRSTETSEDYGEVLKKVKFSPMTWMHDNIGFFYSGYQHQQGKADGSETESSENQKLYYHKLGTDQSEDIVAVEFDDSRLLIGAEVSHCGFYLIVTPRKGTKNNMLYFSKLEKQIVDGKLELTPLVTNLEADYQYVTNLGPKFIFRTNKRARNYKLIVIDFDDTTKEWVDLVQEHPKDVLHKAHAVNTNMAVVCYIRDVKHALSIFDVQTGEKMYDLKLDLGTVTSISGKHFHKEMFYNFYSFVTPNKIYKVTFQEEGIHQTLLHETKIEGFDPSEYETKQVFYESKDKTVVPMFIVGKKNTFDGNQPCLLYGYGGFNIALTPYFAISRIIFINNFNGIFALPNIRGGGEYGDPWHDGGRFQNKQNSFDDFQYAAKYLVNEKYTTKNKLVIQGGSNGGLLVAACINQAPELFGAAICQVGVLDMLRYHKFTIGYAWKSDYGSSEEENEFEYLYKYSPLHNVQRPLDHSQQYPSTLLLTADHDDRVVPLHSLKFIAQLQYTAGTSPFQKKPLFIRVETKAGHGGGKPTTKIIEEVTDYFTFISRALSIEFVP